MANLHRILILQNEQPEPCHYLLQLVTNRTQCIRVIFNDAENNYSNMESFISQLNKIIELANSFDNKPPAIFIGK